MNSNIKNHYNSDTLMQLVKKLTFKSERVKFSSWKATKVTNVNIAYKLHITIHIDLASNQYLKSKPDRSAKKNKILILEAKILQTN